MPQPHDAAYAIPLAGGALKVPLNQGLKPTLKPMANHLRNLVGRRGAYTPVYESLPWGQRYAYGPNTNWKFQVNLNQPTNLERWQHGRVADLDTGQFHGLSGNTPERNLRYQAGKLTDMSSAQLYKQVDAADDTVRFLTSRGIPEESARRLVANKGELAAAMGDNRNYGSYFPGYDNPNLVGVPAGTSPSQEWFTIPDRKFVDIRALSDRQAAPISLTGQRRGGGGMVPKVREDGAAPTHTGTGPDAFQAELGLFPDNPGLKKIYNGMTREYSPAKGQLSGEISIPHSKLPSQGYTRLRIGPNESTSYHPWRAVDGASPASWSTMQRAGAGAPASLSLQQLTGSQAPPADR